MVPIIEVEELAEKLQSGEDFVLLDVREAHELLISRLDPCVHIPMAEVVWRSRQFPPDAEICVLCRTGNRSGTITQALMLRGFTNVRNVKGGINAYAERIDPTLQVY
jgi:adenylyltransferase/sulfurtransferase